MSVHPAPTNSMQELKSCVVHCLRAPYDAQAAAQARACLSNPAFDWPGFLQVIHLERISPLIDDSVGGWDLIPTEVAGAVHRVYLQNFWINALRLEELQKVLILLGSAGIPTILLKGVALLHTVYEKSGLRPMVDTDLLIPARDMDRAGQILSSCGYKSNIAPSMPLDFQTEIAFQKPGHVPWMIELHSSLFSPPHLLSAEQLDWFWKNKTCTKKEGGDVLTLNPTAQILHLSAHLWLHHGGGDLLGMNDLYQLIRLYGERIDWEEVVSVGESFDLLLPLQKVLPELAENWKSPVPGEVLSKLAKMDPSVREKRKFMMFWGNDHNYAKTLLGGAMSFSDWRSRLRYARLVLFPPKQYIIERYKVRTSLLVPFFYAYRLISRGFQQVGRILCKNVRK